MPKKRQDAIHACLVLNHFVGDLVIASRIRQLFQLPAVTSKASPSTIGCANRMCTSYLFLTLVKWTEFYERFHHVIPEDCRADCKRLLRDIERRDIKRFRNKFVGHIWDKDQGRPLTNAEIEVAVTAIVEGDEDAFATWCNDNKGNKYPATVVSIVERTRDRIREEFALTELEVFSG